MSHLGAVVCPALGSPALGSPAPGFPAPGSPALGCSLLDVTEEALAGPCSPLRALGTSLLDVTVGAVGSDLRASPRPSSLVGDGGVRGVRIKRVAGCRRSIKPRPSSSPSSPPLSPTALGFSGVLPAPYRWARGACAVCSRKLRVNGNLGENICERCLSEVFPFNHFTNGRDFRGAVDSFFLDRRHLDKASQLLFNPLCEEFKDTLVDLNRTIGNCSYYDEKQFVKMNKDFIGKYDGQFSMICHNINGLPKKRDEFELLLETLHHNFDILGFTETHLNGVSEKLTTLGDYKWLSNSRISKKGGGVAIYLRPHLTFKRRTDIDIFEEGVFESIFVEVNRGCGSYIVGVIYRPPDSDMARFLSSLNIVLDKVKNKRCYLMGDFNLDLIKSDRHSATGNFLCDIHVTFMNSMGFHPLISLPTRITPPGVLR